MISLHSFAIIALAAGVAAIGQKTSINFEGNGYTIVANGSSVQIVADRADWPAVLRVVDDLAIDFGRVTGTNGTSSLLNATTSDSSLNASLIYNNTGRPFGVSSGGAVAGGTIIAGTIGRSSIIEQLAKEGKIDISAINGTWEAYTSSIVPDPLPGVAQAQVVAGSDRRGTIYGLYSISEQIGVSPWYWFADSLPQKHDVIHASNITVVQTSPSVKYRGFFLNDEAPALTGYIDAKYPRGEYGPGFGADFYHSVFELLLRLRANYLWPAQWNSMFNVDDSRNQALADEYGIVMGTSHTEPMMRATKEWNVFGDGPWQWNTNNESIYPFFVEGAERTKPYEGVITMGMRGSGDTALTADNEIALLESVVAAQADILEKIWGNDSVQNPDIVPQMWCLYKEVQGYYEDGMTVPDWITLLWADDNWGNNRRVPLQNETSRSGGAGVYYHFDYVGDPRNYKWINTIQLQKTWEQMHLAYERQARRIWIVNVGDLKPLELPISHFFDLAYDISLWDKNSVPNWLEMWAAREFGQDVAQNTAQLMTNYSMAAGRRKYELVDPTTYSILNYNEAETVLQQWKDMQTSAKAIMDSLPMDAQASFFEMIYHPVTAGYVFYDIMISTAKNRLYAKQGRNVANTIAKHVQNQFSEDRKLTEQYNNQLDGKWAHMMDQPHIGYEYWQQPMRQALPALQYNVPSERSVVGDMAVSIQGSNASVPGDDMWHTLSSNMLTMSPFDPYGVSSQWIDVYSVGTNDVDWTITSNASFVNISTTSGRLTTDGASDSRVWATFDWDACPEGSGFVLLNISSTQNNASQYLSQTQYGTQYSMPQLLLPYNHTRVPASFKNGFVVSSGHISIELEHYSSTTNNSDVHYETIPGLSRTLSGITLFPVTADSQTTESGPQLSYNLYTFSNSTPGSVVNITIVTTPSLNTDPARPLRYAIQFDDQDIKTVQYVIDQPKGANPVGWLQAVADNAWKSTTNFTYSGAGEHELKLWALEPGVVFNTAWIDLGGIKQSYLGPPESYRVA
ncbi:hypothetical protein HII31_05808 [Pseudocercospora fuligena]|uniref:Gylcosyl hydrolase 115 C-terminal domain-containing protein n=1 Tax=Pseudocercospora fuligena TaxID=685502 RepID=A0A8H6RK05_9PEZI|nr:hypothetical protein HII31_05808 [Pseudocercospora fuligena]